MFKTQKSLYFKSQIIRLKLYLSNNFKNIVIFVAWKLSLILIIFFIVSVARNPQKETTSENTHFFHK